MAKFPTLSGILKFEENIVSSAYFKQESEDVPNSEVLFPLLLMRIQFCQDNVF